MANLDWGSPGFEQPSEVRESSPSCEGIVVSYCFPVCLFLSMLLPFGFCWVLLVSLVVVLLSSYLCSFGLD